MHTIHTTSGFIIDARAYGEAGKVFTIFTRDFGLITVTAQGIRFEKSKLRYHTEIYTFGSFSLVRGKEFWRLTNADTTDLKIDDNFSKEYYEIIVKFALLLRRLLHGEERHTELFDCILNCAELLKNNSGIINDQLKTLESIIVFRILHLLGYIGDDKLIDWRLKSTEFSITLIDELFQNRTLMNQHINKALRESHL